VSGKAHTAPVVLVVDDESPIREIERRILEKGGYEVVEASSGAEAFARIEQGPPPDLMIVDLEMPEMSGEELVQRVHAIRGHLKVLYVTGNIDRLLDARELAWEGEAFLDKPFSAKGLLEAVSLLLTGTLAGPAGRKPVK
jgi:two-component system, cell cycle sensor histidine kinase and response regulator CckA